MSKPNFIITRFTYGSAGKFLSTVLQTSDKIDHWSVVVQNQKNSELIGPVTLEYVSRSFPQEHSLYLQSEPMVPYNTDLYSVGFDRGINVTVEQYIENARLKNDTRLFACLDNDLAVNLIFNRPTVPAFCHGARAVTVTVTTQAEQQWLYQTRWSKHFLETDTEIRYLPSDPEYCNFQSLPAVLRFNNPYRFPIQDRQQIYQDQVINTPINRWYFEPEHFESYDQQHSISNTFIELSSILDSQKFLPAIAATFDKLELGNPDLNLISGMHKIWLSRQL